MEKSDNENVPNVRVSIFISNQNGRLLFERPKLNAHVGDDNTNGQKVQKEFAEKRNAVRVKDVFEIVEKELIAEVKVPCE